MVARQLVPTESHCNNNQNQGGAVNKTILGIVLLIVGIIGLVKVYSLRPVSLDGDHEVSAGEAMYMSAVLGRDNWIREPQYQIYLALSGVISVIGVIQIVRGMRTKQDPAY
jgi:hypothetical protein